MGNKISVQPTADISLLYLRNNRQSLTQDILNAPIYGHNFVLSADYREIVNTFPYFGKTDVPYTGIPTTIGQAIQLHIDGKFEKKLNEEKSQFVPLITISSTTYSSILDLRLGIPPLLYYGAH